MVYIIYIMDQTLSLRNLQSSVENTASASKKWDDSHGWGVDVKVLGKPLLKKVTASLKLKNEEEISK